MTNPVMMCGPDKREERAHSAFGLRYCAVQSTNICTRTVPSTLPYRMVHGITLRLPYNGTSRRPVPWKIKSGETIRNWSHRQLLVLGMRGCCSFDITA